MMQITVFICALLSFAAAATPPACIINAIGVQGSDATDMKSLCDTKQEYVLGNLTESCSSDAIKPAYDHYSSLCLEKAAVSVSALPAETDSSSSGSSSANENNGSDTSNSNSESSKDDEDNGAITVGSTPNLIFAASGLFVTGMTSLLFL